MRPLLLPLAFACTKGMGETCRSSKACAAPGLCLSGVCSGYDCSSDEECENGLVCGTIDGTPGCFEACESDDECSGEQRCLEVAAATEDDGATARYCL